VSSSNGWPQSHSHCCFQPADKRVRSICRTNPNKSSSESARLARRRPPRTSLLNQQPNRGPILVASDRPLGFPQHRFFLCLPMMAGDVHPGRRTPLSRSYSITRRASNGRVFPRLSATASRDRDAEPLWVRVTAYAHNLSRARISLERSQRDTSGHRCINFECILRHARCSHQLAQRRNAFSRFERDVFALRKRLPRRDSIQNVLDRAGFRSHCASLNENQSR